MYMGHSHQKLWRLQKMWMKRLFMLFRSQPTTHDARGRCKVFWSPLPWGWRWHENVDRERRWMVPTAPRHPSSAGVEPPRGPPRFFTFCSIFLIKHAFHLDLTSRHSDGLQPRMWKRVRSGPVANAHLQRPWAVLLQLGGAALWLLHSPTPVPLLPGISSKNVHRVYLHLQPTPTKRPRHLRQPATPRTPESRLCKWSLSLFR